MSEIVRLQCFVLWFIREPKQELGAPAPWSVKLAGNVIAGTLVWSDDDIFVRGDVETPILCGEAP